MSHLAIRCPRRPWPRLALALLLALGALLAALPAPVAAAPGDAWAWGDDFSGQLGDGKVGDGTLNGRGERATPVKVVGLTGATAVATGDDHSLALKTDGTVVAWGSDFWGQLGDGRRGDPFERATPAPVVGLSSIVAIAAGGGFSLALRADGTVWAWGIDNFGQLGDGTINSPDQRHTPIQVVGLTGVVAIAAGNGHGLAVKGDGTVWAWGNDETGQLGDGTVGDGTGFGDGSRATPAQVAGLAGATAVAAGKGHSLALKGDGTVVAWGDNSSGLLGSGPGTPGQRPTPGPVVGLTGGVAIAAGQEHNLALKTDGTVWAWGSNDYGALGDSAVVARNVAAPVAGLTGVIAIAAGRYFNLAAKGDSTTWSWGFDSSGQLGDGTLGTPVDNPTLRPVVGLAGATAVAAGDGHSLAVASGSGPPALTLQTVGTGSVSRSPAGTGGGPYGYSIGAVVTLTAQATGGQTFAGWTIDGVPQGWAPTITITMNDAHTVAARFAAPASFPDVPDSRADAAAIIALATRGTIRGYLDGRYGPDERVQRAQMAALIARAMPAGPHTPPTTLAPPACLVSGTWDCENWGNSFKDRGTTDPNLWRNAGALQHYGVSLGYAGATCTAKKVPSPCYGPGDNVTYAQTISFITRAMKAKGYWVDQPGAPLTYQNVPPAHQLDVRTFHYYTQGLGGVPSAPTTQPDWDAGATRGWFAQALWAALDSYWNVDRVP